MYRVDPQIFEILEKKYGSPEAVIRRLTCPERTYHDWKTKSYKSEWKVFMVARFLRSFVGSFRQRPGRSE